MVGDERCPIVDTWWQTETGGILISPLPGATDLKPGSATKPLFGVCPELVDADGKVLEGAATGNLVLTQSWPGQMRTVYGDHQRFIDTYFKTYRGKYFTGDGCRRDEDGYYWITGRVDDVINVSGHRLGTAEVESALVANHKVAEAAVVGFPHEIKGQGIYAYVTLKAGEEPSGRAGRRTEEMGGERICRRSRGPMRSSSRPACPRHARARSCAASSERSPKATPPISATPPRSPIPAWSTIWSRTRRNRATVPGEGKAMLSWKIGDVKVTRVVELEIPVPYNAEQPFLRGGHPGGAEDRSPGWPRIS